MKIFIALAFLAGKRYQAEGSLKVIGPPNLDQKQKMNGSKEQKLRRVPLCMVQN